MVKAKSMHGTGNNATRKNTHTDRQSGGMYFHAATKKGGSGTANWGKPGDELEIAPIDHDDPAYDSADELFEKAFGGNPKNTKFDWSSWEDMSDEDNLAMTEIEEQMKEDFLREVEKEVVELEDEGEAFFG
eukprot:328136-Rhodomonas_salina.1